jgi:hypothetical protein
VWLPKKVKVFSTNPLFVVHQFQGFATKCWLTVNEWVGIQKIIQPPLVEFGFPEVSLDN